jgi:hypothetical protein
MARESAQATFAQRLLEQPIDEKDVHCIANLLKKKLATTSLWQQEQSCTNTVLARQIRNSVSVQDVGVYVGNLHSIAVGISTCEPTMESHSLSEKDVLEQNVSIRRVGVAVHTVDDIRVALNAFVFPSIAEQVVAQLRQCQSP